MKTVKSLAFALLLSSSGMAAHAAPVPAMAAVSAGITLRAVLIRGLSVLPQQPLDFGVLIPSKGGVESVTVAPDGAVSASNTSTLAPGAQQRQAGLFLITGQPSAGYGIVLQPSVVLSAGAASITVTNLSYGFDGAAAGGAPGRLDASGQQKLFIGGTLNLSPNQPSGEYSGVYTVTITYQ